MRRYLAIAFALALTLGCATHLPPGQIALSGAQISQQALDAVGNAEALLCWSQPTTEAATAAAAQGLLDLKTCGSPTAAQVGLTAAKHVAFHQLLAKAYTTHAAVAAAAHAGIATVTQATDFQAAAQGVLDLASTLTNVPAVQTLIAQAKALLAGATQILDAVKGGDHAES